MPTVLRQQGYRFYFYSHEPNEPPHVDKAGHTAKFWLEPVSLARSVGFAAKDINAISRLVRNYREQMAPVLPMLEPWVERFGYEPS